MTCAYDPGDVDHFIEVADAIEDSFPGIIVEGIEVEGAGAGSMFEVKSAEGPLPVLGQAAGAAAAAGRDCCCA